MSEEAVLGDIGSATGAEALDKIFTEGEAPETPEGGVESEASGAPEAPEIPEDFVPPIRGDIPELPEEVQPVAPAEPPPPVPVDELDPKSSHAWAELKARNKALEEQLAADSSSEAPDTAETEAKIQELQTQAEQYEERLGRYDLAATKSFQARYDAKINGLLGRAMGLLTRSGVEKSAVQALAREALSGDLDTRIRIFGEEAPALQGALINLYEDLDTIVKDRTLALDNWREVSAAREEEAKEESFQGAVAQIQGAMETAVSALKDSGDYLFKDDTSSEEWNTSVKTRLTALGGVLKSGELSQVAKLVAEGQALPTMRAMFAREHQLRLAAEAQLSGVAEATPGLGGAASRTPPSGPAAGTTGEAAINSIWGEEK